MRADVAGVENRFRRMGPGRRKRRGEGRSERKKKGGRTYVRVRIRLWDERARTKRRERRMRWRDSGKDEERDGRWKTRPGYEMAVPQRGQRSRMTTRRPL